ncbi:MAG: hypothetical protein H6983_13070 [Ectothiorhodospiraceae bacterium]|nr:hypothetical protein [Ectothiorhodospiraceae bacterium]
MPHPTYRPLASLPARIAPLMLAASLLLAPLANAAATIELGLCVHVVRGLEFHKRGVTLSAWISNAQVGEGLLPEVNRIWADAGIRFRLTSVGDAALANPPDAADLIAGILAATRDDDGHSNPERVSMYRRLLDLGAERRDCIDVYLVPYLGERSQGVAARRAERVLVTQWSDKGQPSGTPPRRFPLTEARPFTRGSLGRTLAHELGHVLGLDHPDRRRQTELGRLMGGRKPGYRLTPEEIATARARATALAERQRGHG